MNESTNEIVIVALAVKGGTYLRESWNIEPYGNASFSLRPKPGNTILSANQFLVIPSREVIDIVMESIIDVDGQTSSETQVES